MSEERRPRARRSTAPARRAAEEPSNAAAGGVETQRRPAPDTGDAVRHDGPEETHDERVRTPVGADEHPERAASGSHGAVVDEGGHGAAHSDAHTAGDHGAEGHMLGPLDVRAWGAAILGGGIGLLVAYMFYLAIV